MAAYVYEPGRRIISVAEPRLNRMLVRDAHRYASLGEYASGSGLSVDEVVSLLGPALDEGSLGLEVAGGEIFLLTAPGGRPIPSHLADVAPNLWETLRRRAQRDEALMLWKVVRGLEKNGWQSEVIPERVAFGLGHLTRAPHLGVHVGATIVPVMVYPSEQDLVSPVGQMAEYDRAGASAVAVVCAQDGLDRTVTAVRRWALSRRIMPSRMAVVVLEAPRFQPTLLSAADAAVTPISVTRSTLESLAWADPANRGT